MRRCKHHCSNVENFGHKLNRESLIHAAEVIKSGGVIAYPTEACFGFGCDPRNASAIRMILRIKRRTRAKGLILIADRYARLLPYLDSQAVDALSRREQIMNSWPGQHTWLLPASAYASRWVRGDYPNVAVRVTAHREAAQLCKLARTAIISTSANRAARPMLRSGRAVLREFGGEIDFIVDGRIGNAASVSVIRDGASGEIMRGNAKQNK